MHADWSRAMVDKSTNDEKTWWWSNLFFSFLRTQFFEKIQRKLTSKSACCCKKQVDINFPWSMLLSLIEMTFEMFPVTGKNGGMNSGGLGWHRLALPSVFFTS